jgi:L-threonylcarbamoyladenylate synthase
VNGKSMALAYFQPINSLTGNLMDKYWPGALTIVYLARTDKIYQPVRGGKDTVGIRMPDHTLTLEIISQTGVPLLGPSANFHGQPTPYDRRDLDPELVSLVDFVVSGSCPVKNTSTVADSTGDQFRIIRQGALTIDL